MSSLKWAICNGQDMDIDCLLRITESVSKVKLDL